MLLARLNISKYIIEIKIKEASFWTYWMLEITKYEGIYMKSSILLEISRYSQFGV
jgi:hypothetical protein